MAKKEKQVRRDYYAEIPEHIRKIDPGLAQYLADGRRRDDERQRFAEMLFKYREPTVAVQSNPNARIQHLRPHYTNEVFKNAQTVYLAQGCKLSGDYVKGAEYNYSDRIWQWKYNEARAAWETIKASDLNIDSAAAHEMYLRLVFNDPELKLVHILAGFNVSNGYDYQVYGFIPGKPSEAQP